MDVINYLVLAVCYYGAWLFAYDWCRQGSARPMFICVLVIFLGQIIDTQTLILVRSSIAASSLDLSKLPSYQWWYPFRMYPTLIAYIFINVYLTGRMIYNEEHWVRDKAWRRKKLNGELR